jgi:hypothetical protein
MPTESKKGGRPKKKASPPKTEADPGDEALFEALKDLLPGWKARKFKSDAERWSLIVDAAGGYGTLLGGEEAQNWHPVADDVVGLAKELPEDIWAGSARGVVGGCLKKIPPELLQRIVPKKTPKNQPAVERALDELSSTFIEALREEMLSGLADDQG